MFRPAPFRTKIVPNFYPRADEMRQKYEDFFGTPHLDTASNFCLNFWHVKNSYLYLRAYASSIVGHDLYNDFTTHLARYARDEFQMRLTGAYLSIYVNGCHQTIHSDAENGVLGWTWSLTKWHQRTFAGGETMVAREHVFDQLEPRAPKGHTSYMEAFPQPFNQLLMFDDRVAHAINPVMGTMNPLEARVSVHGHMLHVD